MHARIYVYNLRAIESTFRAGAAAALACPVFSAPRAVPTLLRRSYPEPTDWYAHVCLCVGTFMPRAGGEIRVVIQPG